MNRSQEELDYEWKRLASKGDRRGGITNPYPRRPPPSSHDLNTLSMAIAGVGLVLMALLAAWWR